MSQLTSKTGVGNILAKFGSAYNKKSTAKDASAEANGHSQKRMTNSRSNQATSKPSGSRKTTESVRTKTMDSSQTNSMSSSAEQRKSPRAKTSRSPYSAESLAEQRNSPKSVSNLGSNPRDSPRPPESPKPKRIESLLMESPNPSAAGSAKEIVEIKTGQILNDLAAADGSKSPETELGQDMKDINSNIAQKDERSFCITCHEVIGQSSDHTNHDTVQVSTVIHLVHVVIWVI